IRPAPDAGTAPFYGYSVVDDGTYTYLFGNNLVYGDNTETSVARVPSGQVTTTPYEYWTGSAWSRSRGDAEAVYDPGGYRASLEIASVAGTSYAATKVDDFFGTNIDILSAPDPTGPWTVGATFRAPVKPAAGQSTYNAGLVGLLRAGGRIVIQWSNNN